MYFICFNNQLFSDVNSFSLIIFGYVTFLGSDDVTKEQCHQCVKLLISSDSVSSVFSIQFLEGSRWAHLWF